MYPTSGDSSFQNDLYSNIPNMSLMFTMWTTTFGNMNFNVQPPMKGAVNGGWPSVPYLSLEALVYQQQASNPSSAPVNTIAGVSTGQQVVGGTTTQQDQFGTSRVLNGFQPGSPVTTTQAGQVG